MSFRQFIEEQKPNYFSALQDELGIDPESFEKMPQVDSFFSLDGKSILNTGAYQIVGFVKDGQGKPTHVKVKMVDTSPMPQRQWRRKGDEPMRVPNEIDDKVRVIPLQGKEKEPGFEDLVLKYISQQPQGQPGMM